MQIQELEQVYSKAADGRLFLTLHNNLVRLAINRILTSGKIPNIEGTIELVNSQTPGNCASFAFKNLKGESWAFVGMVWCDYPKLWGDTSSFLEELGYQPVKDNPQSQDIIVYGDGLRPVTASHFGVLQDNNWVVSKFANYPVFHHKIGALPSWYGNTVTFFRK